MEARPDPNGNLALYLPEPLLTRLKADMRVSLIVHTTPLVLFFFLFQNPCLAVRHASLSSAPIWETLGLRFHHQSLLIRFTVDIQAGLRTPAEICDALNQGLMQIRPELRLIHWNADRQTGRLGLGPNQSLFSDQRTLLEWMAGTDLTWEERQAWTASEIWEPAQLPPPTAEPAHQLVVKGNAEIPLPALFFPKTETFHCGVLTPATDLEVQVDMSSHAFNQFYRGDPINSVFADHLANKLVDLITQPPLFKPMGLKLSVRVAQPQVVLWSSTPPVKMELSLRLGNFWRRYFLPQSAMVNGPEVVGLAEIEGLRSHPYEPNIILTTSPCPNPGQSLVPTPFVLGSDLLGDNFLRAHWALPCLTLIEPEEAKFQLVHQPILQLEGIQGLGSWVYLSLLDADNSRIPCGAKTRIWLEIASF